MLKALALVIAGLAAGFALAFWFAPGAPGPGETAFPTEGTVAPVARGTDGSTARLAALETALAVEAEQRAALEARVGDLAAEVDALRAIPRDETQPRNRPTDAEAAEARQRFDPAARQVALQEWQTEQLVAHGFSPQRAEFVMRLSQVLRMESIQAEYDAARGVDTGTQTNRTLRSELGDAEYEQYLRALNQPTSVPVLEVLASSPSERAGLKPGDEVIAYGGERVFNIRELNELTREGTAGQSVVVDIMRDGQQIQLVMPRGPLGITGGARGGRGPPVR
jgi:hypothetical protein